MKPTLEQLIKEDGPLEMKILSEKRVRIDRKIPVIISDGLSNFRTIDSFKIKLRYIWDDKWKLYVLQEARPKFLASLSQIWKVNRDSLYLWKDTSLFQIENLTFISIVSALVIKNKQYYRDHILNSIIEK